jgi:hypothetical protein
MIDSMTLLSRSAARALLVLLCVGVGCAQPPTPRQEQETPPPPAVSPRGPTKRVGKAEAHYSRLSGVTEALLMPPPVVSSGGRGETLTMTPYFSVPGEPLRRPERIYFMFLSQSHWLKFNEDRKFTVFADGREFVSGDSKLLRSECREGDVCQEMLQSPPLTYDNFLTLLRAKKIGVRLGPVEFGLKPEDVESFRDLSRLLDQ